MVHMTFITQLSKPRGRYCGEYEDRHEKIVKRFINKEKKLLNI